MTAITSAPASSGATGVATPYASMKMGTGTAVDKTSLGKDQFLNLLVTQMRYQDPSAPMDSSKIMEQTSSLAMVEQLKELTTTQREAFGLQLRLSASGFVGQQVGWTDADKVAHTGVVDGASFAGPMPVLKVGDKTVSLDAVSLISAAASAPVTPPAPVKTSTSTDGTSTLATDGASTTTTAARQQPTVPAI